MTRTSCRITAVICTFNRAKHIPAAVRSVLSQTLSLTEYEVIVVDNRSTDETADVVRQLQESAPHLRYEYEAELGLNPARNRGWRSANAPYVAYLDDDAIADRGWLAGLLHAFETVQPAPAAVGGKILPLWEVPRPRWLPDSMLDLLSLCDYAPVGHFLEDVIHRRNLIGANIAFAKSALERVGGFTRGLDRIGSNLLSGGELLLQVQLEDLGLPIYYEPDAFVEHYVPASRVTPDWLLARAYWGGISDALLVFFRRGSTLSASLRLCLYAARRLKVSLRFSRGLQTVDDVAGLERIALEKASQGFAVGALKTLGLVAFR